MFLIKLILQLMLFIILSLVWLVLDYVQPGDRIIMVPVGLALALLSTTIPSTIDGRERE